MRPPPMAKSGGCNIRAPPLAVGTHSSIPPRATTAVSPARRSFPVPFPTQCRAEIWEPVIHHSCSPPAIDPHILVQDGRSKPMFSLGPVSRSAVELLRTSTPACPPNRGMTCRCSPLSSSADAPAVGFYSKSLEPKILSCGFKLVLNKERTGA